MGILITITGNGKGKTTSALGNIARTLGHNGQVAILQFIKSKPDRLGEYKFFSNKNVLWENFGTGFCWTKEEFQNNKTIFENGWKRFKELYESNKYDLIILDEFTYLLINEVFDNKKIYEYLEKKQKSNLIITGRYATDELIKISDTVSEIVEIKHHSKTLNLPPTKMIEY